MRWAYLFRRNYTPNFSKDESHALHINIVGQKTGPGIPSGLCSGDSSRFSCFYTPMTSFQAPLKMYGTCELAYFLKVPHTIVASLSHNTPKSMLGQKLLDI